MVLQSNLLKSRLRDFFARILEGCSSDRVETNAHVTDAVAGADALESEKQTMSAVVSPPSLCVPRGRRR